MSQTNELSKFKQTLLYCSPFPWQLFLFFLSVSTSCSSCSQSWAIIFCCFHVCVFCFFTHQIVTTKDLLVTAYNEYMPLMQAAFSCKRVVSMGRRWGELWAAQHRSVGNRQMCIAPSAPPLTISLRLGQMRAFVIWSLWPMPTWVTCPSLYFHSWWEKKEDLFYYYVLCEHFNKHTIYLTKEVLMWVYYLCMTTVLETFPMHFHLNGKGVGEPKCLYHSLCVLMKWNPA